MNTANSLQLLALSMYRAVDLSSRSCYIFLNAVLFPTGAHCCYWMKQQQALLAYGMSSFTIRQSSWGAGVRVNFVYQHTLHKQIAVYTSAEMQTCTSADIQASTNNERPRKRVW